MDLLTAASAPFSMRKLLKRVILISLVLTAVEQAAAVDAPHGAYLGCFDGEALSAEIQVQSVNKETSTTCAPSCAAANFGLAFITTDYRCFCSNTIPIQSGKLTYMDCLQGKAGVAVFYLHKDASSTLCRSSNPPMTSATWKVAYGAENVEFNPADNSISVKLDGLNSPAGARLQTQDGMFQYGMYQVEAKVSAAPGVVSSFYTRSSGVYPNDLVPDFSEIDWEFLNGNPGEPNTIWLNSLTKAKSNGELGFPPAVYQKLINSTGLTGNSWTRYTINWQPSFVAWVLNSTLLQVSTDGQVSTVSEGGQQFKKAYQTPNLASMQVISVWTDTRPMPDNFGGVLNLANGPYYSYFRNLRRIICDKAMPTDAVAAAIAMGPAWLYGKPETITTEDLAKSQQQDAAQASASVSPEPVADAANWVPFTGSAATDALSTVRVGLSQNTANSPTGGTNGASMTAASQGTLLTMLMVLSLFICLPWLRHTDWLLT